VTILLFLFWGLACFVAGAAWHRAGVARDRRGNAMTYTY
jgi:hypothetical protein